MEERDVECVLRPVASATTVSELYFANSLTLTLFRNYGWPSSCELLNLYFLSQGRHKDRFTSQKQRPHIIVWEPDIEGGWSWFQRCKGREASAPLISSSDLGPPCPWGLWTLVPDVAATAVASSMWTLTHFRQRNPGNSLPHAHAAHSYPLTQGVPTDTKSWYTQIDLLNDLCGGGMALFGRIFCCITGKRKWNIQYVLTKWFQGPCLQNRHS